MITESSALTRRNFLAGSAATSLTVLKAGAARSAQANSKLEVGIVGCGNRGKWIGKLFEEQGNAKVVAIADYFAERAAAGGKQFGVATSRCYDGLSCYQKMLEGKLDAVAIESPPYFHPEQAAAAVEAGKHVYLAKPIAVDVPGCQTIADSGRKASEKKLCFLVDFQTRNNELYREAVMRVHAGDIGQLVSGQANYFCGRLHPQARKSDPPAEARLKNWVFDIALSGDIITEQNIHALDVATWIVNAAPVRAYGTGGRKARTDVGDCWDNFTVIFWFPGDFLLDFSSGQFVKGHSDIGCRVYGSNGTIDTHYGGNVSIRGDRDKEYAGGNTGRIYAEGATNNIKDFRRFIDEGNFANDTVAPSVRSNLTTILGRTAAYRGAEVTWEEMMEANEKLDAKLGGLRA